MQLRDCRHGFAQGGDGGRRRCGCRFAFHLYVADDEREVARQEHDIKQECAEKRDGRKNEDEARALHAKNSLLVFWRKDVGHGLCGAQRESCGGRELERRATIDRGNVKVEITYMPPDVAELDRRVDVPRYVFGQTPHIGAAADKTDAPDRRYALALVVAARIPIAIVPLDLRRERRGRPLDDLRSAAALHRSRHQSFDIAKKFRLVAADRKRALQRIENRVAADFYR